jgi:hypothetical protein
MPSVRLGVFAVIGMFCGLLNYIPAALGEDFRVDNAIYADAGKEPTSQSTTIFYNGIVYDCMTKPAETVVFDKASNRFVVLNMARKVRTQLTTEEVATFVDRLRPLAAKSSDPLVQILADPKFQESTDENTGEVTLHSPWITYRLTLTQGTEPSIVKQYHDFCDWYARLNALLIPSSRPPFARLVVNAAMAQRQSVPSQILLTLTSGKGATQERTTIRSEHRWTRTLTPADLDRVAEIRKSVDEFKPIHFDQYRKNATR